MRSTRLALLSLGSAALLFGSVAGCSGGTPPPEPPGASLTLGTGTARFTEVADGDELPMIKGAQGGWHVWVSVRVEGMDVNLASLRIEHQPADESESMVAVSQGVVFDPAAADGSRVSLGWPAIFSNPSCSVGRLHRIRVILTTASGERLMTERDIIPTPGMFPPPACGVDP